jgi:hypothetical protein
MNMWTEFRPMALCCELGNETLGCIKGGDYVSSRKPVRSSRNMFRGLIKTCLFALSHV